MLRGGSWNNNPENARAANRNRNNNPDNRNNNIGFRLLRSPTPHWLSIPCCAADQGLQVTRKRWDGAGRSGPQVEASGEDEAERPLGFHPGALFLNRCGGLTNPAAQQTADIRDHAADVFILTVAYPSPAVGEA